MPIVGFLSVSKWIYSQGRVFLTSLRNFEGRVGTCRDHRMVRGEKQSPGSHCRGKKGAGGIHVDWPDRTLGIRLVEPVRAAGGGAGAGRRKRALSNLQSWRRCTSGVAMAANATTNPSQLLPLGNGGPAGNGGEELKLRVGGHGAAGRGVRPRVRKMRPPRGLSPGSVSPRSQAARLWSARGLLGPNRRVPG